jgi:tetraprenyl-beta-curcumene synthase
VAAARYWIGVFPFACREIHRWERRARAIPDPSLKGLALRALRDERGNLEGAAAFAAFVPRAHRTKVARAAMAFQAAYDYADAISEQPGSGRTGNVYRLHQSLRIALDSGAPHLDYYAYHDRHDDDGYLNFLVDRCRAALRSLPSFPTVEDCAQVAATRIITYQSLNHEDHEMRDVSNMPYKVFAEWAEGEVPSGTGLRWWEVGAAAGSSLTVFALMSAAALPVLPVEHVFALERTYFPWVGSLHTLLDSLIDEREDSITHQHCLTACYTSREEAASRLRMLAEHAVEGVMKLPDSDHHMMILAAMVCFYLAAPQARGEGAMLAASGVLGALGEDAMPAMLILRARHIVGNRC